MTKFAVVFAAAGMLLAAPSFTSSAKAAIDAQAEFKVAQVEVRVGGRDRGMRRHHRDCTTKVIYRHGHKTVIKKCG